MTLRVEKFSNLYLRGFPVAWEHARFGFFVKNFLN